MKTMSLEDILKAKEARRRRLARAPFPEKIRALVRLQEMAAPLLRARGRAVRPWRIESGDAGQVKAKSQT